MTLMVIKTRSLIVSVQEESGFDKNLDLLTLAEAFHMPKLAKAARQIYPMSTAAVTASR